MRKTLLDSPLTRLRSLWLNRSVRTQIVLIVAAINLAAVLLGAGIAVLNARISTRVEIEASLESAQRFVDATIRQLATEGQLDRLTQSLSSHVDHLRHVRIILMDPSGGLNILSRQSHAATGGPSSGSAPAWFAALVSPKYADRSMRVVSVPHAQPVIIAGEPADEIAEAWQSFYAQALVWLALNGLALTALFMMVDRVLDPLGALSRGMLSLEGGDYTARLKRPSLKELAVITDRFNMLAVALDAARNENRELHQQLITVQDEERRFIANELHDEVGPCLFGISANASSIKTLVEQLNHRIGDQISDRIAKIVSIVERLKRMNRALLSRLKPDSLGQVKLHELIEGLVCKFQQQHPEIKISFHTEGLADTYGEVVDLTIYRCAQEGITNAVRHGLAEQVTIELIQCANGERFESMVRLVLRDDGAGFCPSMHKGFGLTAMNERVRSLGGVCLIDSVPGNGATLTIELPIRIEIPIRYESADDLRVSLHKIQVGA